MANPYFNAAYYLQTNPDVLAGGFTLETAEEHYLQYGANEAYMADEDTEVERKPAPWFDIQHYFADNPDLIPGGVTPATAFEHFTTYGMYEGRTPNPNAAPLTAENLATYAAENEDLQEAFGIEDTDNLTEDQQNALAQHYYQYGYAEDRDGTPGSNYVLTADDDDETGTNGDDAFNADADEDGNATLNDGDVLDGSGGDNVLNIGVGGLESGAAPTLTDIQTIVNSDIGIIDDSEEGTGQRVDKTLDLTNAEGVEAVWSDFSNLEQSGRWSNGEIIGNPAMNAQVNYVGADAETVFGIANVPAQVGRVSTDPGGAGVTGRGTLSVTFAEADSVLNLALAGNAEDSYYAANAGVVQAEYNIDVAEGNSGTLVLSAGVETVTVSGAGDLAIQDRDYSELIEFDASAMTGNLRLGEEDRTGNDDAPFGLGADFVIKGGSGDDDFNLSGVTTSGEVDAGAGDDVIIVDVTGVTGGTEWELTGGEGEDVFVVAGNWGAGEVTLNDTAITIADFNGAEDSLLLGFGGDDEAEDVVLSFGRQDDVDGAIEDADAADAAAALDAVLVLFNSQDGLLDSNGNKANIAQFEFDGNTYVVYGDNANTEVGVGSITLTGVDLDLSLDNVMAV